ncbi:MAG: hypothetical protein AAGC85_23770, partial [Bacteroidota bacterium]
MRYFVNTALLTLALSLLSSCTINPVPGTPKQALPSNGETESTEPIETHFTYGNPHHFDSLGLTIFPLTFKNTPKGYASKTRFDEYSSYDSR